MRPQRIVEAQQLHAGQNVPSLTQEKFRSVAGSGLGASSQSACPALRGGVYIQRICGVSGRRRAAMTAAASANGSAPLHTGQEVGNPAGSGELPNLSTIKGILYDIDGTLCHSDPLHLQAFQELLLEAGFNGGVPIDEAFFKQHISGRHNPEIAADLFPAWSEKDREVWYLRKEARFRELAGGGALHPTPGLTDFMAWAEGRGLKAAAVTNAPRDNAELMLKGLGLEFEVLVIGEECVRAKPHPDPYLQALSLLGLQSEEVIVVEDSPSGLKAGVAAGCACVGITSTQEEGVLRAAGASLTLPDFRGLVARGEEECRGGPAGQIGQDESAASSCQGQAASREQLVVG